MGIAPNHDLMSRQSLAGDDAVQLTVSAQQELKILSDSVSAYSIIRGVVASF